MKTSKFLMTTASFLIVASAVVVLKGAGVASAQPQTPATGNSAAAQNSTPPVPATATKTTANDENRTMVKGGAAHAPRVYFLSPKDGAKVSSPVKVKFGVDGYQVKPAGSVDALTGHHHVIVDGKATPEGEIVPADATHLHYGKGQTEAEIPLSSGDHTLTLQFADGSHKSYGPAMSSTIHITVK